MIVVIVGMPGSGKSTAAEALRRRGFKMVELSTAIKEEMVRQNIEINPKSIEEFTLSMKKKHGKDVWAKITAKKLVSHAGDVVIVGLRSTEELRTIRATLGDVPLIAILAPSKSRYLRLSHRRILPITTHKEFDIREHSNVIMGVPKALKAADVIISNRGTRKDLTMALREAIEAIKTRQARSSSGSKG